MVQRTALNKPDVHADHAKTQKLLVNRNPSLQHHNTKKTKKKMKISELISPHSQKPPLALVLTQPNYMKSTTSSDARKSSNSSKHSLISDKNKTSLKMMKPPSFKPMKVCPYNYCSLNGHHHVPLPPLKCFLSARRHALKTPRRVKMEPTGGDPSFDEKPQEDHTDFSVEIYDMKKESAGESHDDKVVEMVFCYEIDSGENLEQTGDRHSTEIDETQEVDLESSDMDWGIGQNTPLYLDSDDYEHTSKTEKKQDIIHGGFIIELRDELSYRFSEIPDDEVSHESLNEVDLKSDDVLSDCDGESIGSCEVNLSNTETSVPVLIPKEREAAPDNENDLTKDQVLNQTAEHANESNPELSEPNFARNSFPTRAKVKCKKPTKENTNKTGHIHTRAPNFLPVESEREAEKVDLRHREVDERKNAEEWMVDYALRQAVRKLAPYENRKVALLVEAFENVVPTMRVRNSLVFHHARPLQARS